MRGVAALVLVVVATTVSTVSAQAPGGEPRVRVGGGVVWFGSYGVGDGAAALRPNSPDPAPAPYGWFATRATLGPAPGVTGRVEVALLRALSIEAAVSYAWPTLTLAVSGDTEAEPASASEQVQHYEVEVGALLRVPWGRTARVHPFVSGGAGYVRQLHEGRTLVETGQTYSGGGGAGVWLRAPAAGRRAIELRVEARAAWRRGGIDFAGRSHLYPSMRLTLLTGL